MLHSAASQILVNKFRERFQIREIKDPRNINAIRYTVNNPA